MLFANLDSITRRYLFENGLPIHWYAEVFTHCSTALRELSLDTLKIINAERILVNDYGAFDLPGDFQDDLAVCSPVGDALVALPKQDALNPLRLHDAESGAFVSYSDAGTNEDGSTDFLAFPVYGTGIGM